MDDLYLIAHKVRGEPAFDIAAKVPMADGDWWIIPTSGHRAYPFLWWLLSGMISVEIGDLPPDLPDHYPSAAPPRSGRPGVSANASHIPPLENI